MISSRNGINIDLFSEAHRFSGRISVGPSGLLAQLNDANSSLMEIEDVYFSRLDQPAKIVAHFETAHLTKAQAALIVLARREDLGSHGQVRAGYSRVVSVPVQITTPQFEVQGQIEVIHKYDAAEVLIGGTGRFVMVFNAAAIATAYPETTVAGGAILVNKAQVELIAPITARSK
ncbi:MAG: hypothetical protein IT317_23590 [Anaerolineales bacterium]|nr:hypothetical protein [Anaerolineales bacterium]